MRAAILLSLATAVVVSAQTLSSEDVAPAATVVVSDDAGLDLFKTETQQITDEVITDLLDNEEVADFAALFDFANGTVASPDERKRRMRRTLRCKSAPGDLLWPSKLVWNVFDLLLAGALEPIVPIASVCYQKSEFNNYNAAQCAKVTDEWAVATTQ